MRPKVATPRSAAEPREWPDVEERKKTEADRPGEAESISLGRLRVSKKALVAVTLALLPLLYFYPAVTGRVLLAPGDGWTQIFGLRVLIGRMIAQGTLPLWDPYIFAGMPLLASIQPGALYPPSWLFAFLSPGVAMNIMVIVTYHLALVGTYLYARCIRIGRLGALAAGIAFTFGGYMLTHLGHTNRIAAAAWLPWVLLAIEHLAQRARWRWVMLGALFVVLQVFAGEPQMTLYTVMVGIAYGLFSLIARAQQQQRRWRFMAAGIAMAICGALLSAIQLLPEVELLRQTERAEISYEYFAGYSLPPWQTVMFIFPYFFGGAAMPPYRVPYWGQWSVAETCGYVGLLSLLLGLAAVFGAIGERRKVKGEEGNEAQPLSPLVWFWSGCAVIALLLAFGAHLPLGLHHWLYRVPSYNLFRASGRHMLECTFALAVLAGLGMNYLQAKRKAGRRAFYYSAAAMAVVVAGVTIIYRFFGEHLVTATPRSAWASSLVNYEALFPLIFFLLSVGALWLYTSRRARWASALLLAVLMADLGAFGQFFEWRLIPYSLTERLNDPPSVQAIKARETDLHSFRIVSHAAGPYQYYYDWLDYPNISIVRGLQSVNGYDPVRPLRPMEIAGDMTLEGVIEDTSVFNAASQGLNLLNVKYLVRERPGPLGPERGVVYEGVRFHETMMNMKLAPGDHREIEVNGMEATELAIVSALGRSTHIPDGEPIIAIKLYATDGQVIEHTLQAGRDSAEWAYDRADVRSVIKHQRARVVESYGSGGFAGHRYLGRLSFPRLSIARIELDYVRPDTDIMITRASLHDAVTGASIPLDPLGLPPQRWRKLESFGPMELYENLKAMPRAWFVRRVAVMPSAEVLRTIKEGKFADGMPFDPAEVALLEREDLTWGAIALPTAGETAGAQVKVTRYEPQRIELRTTNQEPGFLVLSEIYYRGWEAWVDGKRTPVYRPNYTLRGIAVPPGEHQVTFVYRAPSFRTGAAYSALGVLILIAGAGVSRIRAGRSQTRTAARTFHVRWPSFFSIVATVVLLIYGYILVSHAAYAVGLSDSSGYGNIARSVLAGEITQPVPMLDELGIPESIAYLFIPLSYGPGPRPKTMAPFYPVGLPLHMAVAVLISGWAYGPFLVSPLAAVLSLVLIYLTGLELGLSRQLAVAGAVILAAFPAFVFIALQPMSDVLATCWALAAIWAALRTRRHAGWALLAGAALGAAVLVRPIGILLLIPILLGLRLKPKILLLFILGGLPPAGIFCAYNIAAYGHPLQVGYTAMGIQVLVKLSGFTDRFGFYVYWLVMTSGPLLLGWLAVVANRKIGWKERTLLITCLAAFLLFYSCYDIYDAWWYTRFLLPGIPAMILGALLATRDAVGRWRWLAEKRRRLNLRGVVGLALLIIVLGFELYTLRHFNVLSLGAGEAVHAVSCRWADRVLPDQALVVAMEMSGALKFYANRPSVRWDYTSAEQWQLLKERAAEKGYRWYALLMSHEVALAQQRLPGSWIELGKVGQVGLWQIEP